ncbi:unnamed protein product, partial [Amoebophrya sp. A25]
HHYPHRYSKGDHRDGFRDERPRGGYRDDRNYSPPHDHRHEERWEPPREKHGHRANPDLKGKNRLYTVFSDPRDEDLNGRGKGNQQRPMNGKKGADNRPARNGNWDNQQHGNYNNHMNSTPANKGRGRPLDNDNFSSP